MVRHYKKKGIRKEHTTEFLNNALEKIRNGQSLRSVATELKIDKMILSRYKKKVEERTEQERTEGEIVEEGKVIRHQRKPGHPTVFSSDVEANLAEHIKVLAKWGFALGRLEVLHLIKDYVEQNGLNVPFKNNMPGSDWFVGFCKRNKLSLKRLEPLEKCRRIATGDPFIIHNFYDLLQQEIEKNELENKPQCIYNLDETSFCSDPSRVIGISGVGQKAHRYTEGCGRGNTTVLACVSAEGKALPPLIIFQATNLWTSWKGDKDLPGTFYSSTDNGWMTSVVFQSWFEKFCETVKERLILLLFDGHMTHLDETTIKYARQQNICIIKLPAHTTDVLQPLDKCCFKSLKYKWDSVLIEWFRKNQRKLQKNEFVNLLCEIWNDGMKAENIVSGFRTTGIFPLDRSKYPISRFHPDKYQRYLKSKNPPINNVLEKQLATNLSLPVTPSASVTPSTSVTASAPVTPSTSFMPSAPVTSLDPDTFYNEPVAGSSHFLESLNSEPGPSTAIEIPPNLELFQKESSPTASSTSTPKSFKNLLIEMFKGKTEHKKITKRKVDPTSKVITSEEYMAEITKKKDLELKKKQQIDMRKKQTLMKKIALQNKRNLVKRQKTIVKKRQVIKEKVDRSNKKKIELANNSMQQKSLKKGKPAEKKRRIINENSDSDTSNDEEIEPVSQIGNRHDSDEDVEICELQVDDYSEILNPIDIKVGDFLLAKFKGGLRNCTTYKYVVTVLSIDSNKMEVMGLLSENDKKTFKKRENDISSISMADIVAKLPVPDLIMSGHREKYVFEKVVEVFEAM